MKKFLILVVLFVVLILCWQLILVRYTNNMNSNWDQQHPFLTCPYGTIVKDVTFFPLGELANPVLHIKCIPWIKIIFNKFA